MAAWVLSPIAESELTAILEYIAKRSSSPDVAEKVRQDFAAAFDRLAAFPGIGRERKELTGGGPRWWVIHSYHAIYLPDTKPLRIVRIVHGKRNLAELFKYPPDQEKLSG